MLDRYRYVILDVFSRYVPRWMVVQRETATRAKRPIAETVAKQEIPPDTLTVHADRGSSMTSRPVAVLAADLGVGKSHSRPHTSNDNPYSESQFRILNTGPPSRPGALRLHRGRPGLLWGVLRLVQAAATATRGSG